MKIIPLTQNKFAMVDDFDYELVNKWKWYYLNAGYAVRTTNIDGEKKMIYMHRFIMETLIGRFDLNIDHIDTNKLNNTRKNLRFCSQKNNSKNLKLSKKNKSGYKGVCWSKNRNKYIVQIGLNNKVVYLGYFKTAREGALAYNKAAKKYYGKYANFNQV